MQPHQPYLGKKADEIRSKIRTEMDIAGMSPKIRGEESSKQDKNNHLELSRKVKMKDAARDKYKNIDVERSDIIEAYNETLSILLENVEEMIDFLDGKTVISADHGEFLGECPYLFSNRLYGHPEGRWISELRKVPWFIIDSNQRRTITAEPPDRYDSIDEEELDSKLEALGYK